MSPFIRLSISTLVSFFRRWTTLIVFVLRKFLPKALYGARRLRGNFFLIFTNLLSHNLYHLRRPSVNQPVVVSADRNMLPVQDSLIGNVVVLHNMVELHSFLAIRIFKHTAQ